MTPTAVFCPNLECHARGQSAQGNIGIHSQKDQMDRKSKATFSPRPPRRPPPPALGDVHKLPEVGGLHHHYE